MTGDAPFEPLPIRDPVTFSAADHTDPTLSVPAPHRRRGRVGVAIVAVLLVGAAFVGGLRWRTGQPQTMSPTTMSPTTMIAPAGVIDLSTVSGGIATEYIYAATHHDAYEQMQCWCGCRDAFGHRSLADCFVRGDGRWEAHGAGCAVCLGEATTAHQQLDAGRAPPDVARDLDTSFGPNPRG